MLPAGIQESCLDITHARLEPYPDISGIGVLISFVGAAFIILLLLLASYLISFDPGNSPFQPSHNHHCSSATSAPCRSWRPNSVDEKIIGSIRSTSARLASCVLPPSVLAGVRSFDFEQAFSEAIIAICDMQMFTGGGILISGFLTLHDKVSAHHWNIIVYLAWFSTTSHLAGLTIIRSYLHCFPRKRNLRLVIMLLVLTMLLAAMVPTQFFAWDYGMDKFLPGCATLCFFDFKLARHMWSKATDIACEHDGSNPMRRTYINHETVRGMQNMALSICLLFLGLLMRALKIFPPLSGFLTGRLRRKLSEIGQRFLFWLRPRRFLGTQAPDTRPSFVEDAYAFLIFMPGLALFYSIRLWLDLFGSMLIEIYWLFVSMVWGVFKLSEARGSRFYQVRAEENRWTFGQILAMLLLASPLFNILTIITTNTKERRMEDQVPRTAGFENTNVCPCGSLGTDLVTWMRPSSQRTLSEEHKGAMMSLMDHRGYYGTAPWLGSTLSTTCLVSFLLTTWVLFMAKSILLNMGSGYYNQSFTEFWVGDFGQAWAILYGLFPGTVFTTLFGMLLHGWLQSGSWRSTKSFLLWKLDFFIHGGIIFGVESLSVVFSELLLPLLGGESYWQSHIVGVFMILGLCLVYSLCFLGLRLTGRADIRILRQQQQ